MVWSGEVRQGRRELTKVTLSVEMHHHYGQVISLTGASERQYRKSSAPTIWEETGASLPTTPHPPDWRLFLGVNTMVSPATHCLGSHVPQTMPLARGRSASRGDLKDTADTCLCLLPFPVLLTVHIVSADASHQPVFHYLLYAEILQIFDSEFPPVIYILIFICLLELMASKNYQYILPPLG